ncbi:MAG: DUF1330 domain-containing protein [Proteobacteria bacterium]|nr:DUF1330 domain-containing protein [Pseudomonadota bacterium]
MPIQPRGEQMKALFTQAPVGPLAMLNLLRFKEKAVYADGRETNLTGREAYEVYSEAMTKLIEADGGQLVYSGATNLLVIGEGDLEWDAVGIAEYSSLEGFQKIMSSPEYREIAAHREAGLSHQLLVNLLNEDQAKSLGK